MQWRRVANKFAEGTNYLKDKLDNFITYNFSTHTRTKYIEFITAHLIETTINNVILSTFVTWSYRAVSIGVICKFLACIALTFAVSIDNVIVALTNNYARTNNYADVYVHFV